MPSDDVTDIFQKGYFIYFLHKLSCSLHGIYVPDDNTSPGLSINSDNRPDGYKQTCSYKTRPCQQDFPA